MKGSVKANLIVFLIIAVIAFCISLTFANLTIHEENDSYKLIAIKNNSFEPAEIDYVPTYVPKNDTNKTTNTTNVTDDIEDIIDWNDTDDELEDDYEEKGNDEQ